MKLRSWTGDVERVVLPHVDAVYNFARWLVRDPRAAEDVVQAAFAQALKGAACFDGRRARAWLLRIARDLAHAYLETISLGRAAVSDAELGAAIALGPAVQTARAGCQDLAEADEALDALPVELRECILLREIEGLPYGDIARVTGVPVETVISRLSSARQVLRSLRLHFTAAGRAF
jgi:RNA polymerase sigma factor (sigma-70 family)